MFLAPKLKHSLTIDNYGIIQEHKTFKGFNDSKKLLDRSQYFKTIEGENISAMLPKSWQKSFIGGIAMPAKIRFCNECTDKVTCKRFISQVNENKEFEDILNEL